MLLVNLALVSILVLMFPNNVVVIYNAEGNKLPTDWIGNYMYAAGFAQTRRNVNILINTLFRSKFSQLGSYGGNTMMWGWGWG